MVCLVACFLCIFLIKKNEKTNSNNQNLTDNNEEKPDDDNGESQKEEEKDKDYNNALNINKKKYKMEELITNKLYNQANTLFLYQSNKVMNLDLEMGSDTSQTIDIQNFTKITKNMEFGFIITEKHQEKYEDKRIIKNYYTGYLSLLNLTINNGTDDLNIVNDEELYKSINEINIEQEVNYDLIDSSELLDSSSLIDSSDKVDNFRILEENETDSKNISFIKINFYENGKIKDIFIPNDFYEENMPIFEEIMKLYNPKIIKRIIFRQYHR